MNVRTLKALLKARGLTRSELVRRGGVTRQTVSLWFGREQVSPQSRHLIRVAQVLGVSAEELDQPLPCLDPDIHARLCSTLLWDGLYPDLDDLAVALNAGDVRALGRFVEVYGLFAAEATLGSSIWAQFPEYKRHIHPVRRRELEILWDWHEARIAA